MNAKAPPGAIVGIYYDARVDLADGATHALRTPTGRIYVVVAARLQARGRHAGRRWHLRCLVAEAAPDGAVVHSLVWYKRGKEPRR